VLAAGPAGPYDRQAMNEPRRAETPRPSGSTGDELPNDTTGSVDAPPVPPVPWHFKLIAVLVGIYIALRIVQMLGWIGVSVKDLHNGIALAIIALNGSAAIWGLIAWWRKLYLPRGFRVLALCGWHAYFPQILLGVALYGSKHRAPTGWQHYIYGIAAVLGISAGSFYRRRMPGREAMVYGLVALFLTGVAIRAFVTGHG
jgi:hypothetical protein